MYATSRCYSRNYLIRKTFRTFAPVVLVSDCGHVGGLTMSSMVTRMRRMAMEKLLVWGNVSMGKTRSGRNGSPLYTWEGGRVRWTRDSMHSPAEKIGF